MNAVVSMALLAHPARGETPTPVSGDGLRLGAVVEGSFASSQIITATPGSSVRLRGPLLGGALCLGWQASGLGAYAEVGMFRWWVPPEAPGAPVGLHLSPLFSWAPTSRIELAVGPSAQWIMLGGGSYRAVGGRARLALHVPLGNDPPEGAGSRLAVSLALRGGWTFTAISLGLGVERL